MATSLRSLSTKLCRSLFISQTPVVSPSSVRFSSILSSNEDSDHENSASDFETNESIRETLHQPQQSPSPEPEEEVVTKRAEYQLENGLDLGIYKAIIVGQVGQSPISKKLKNGRTVTLFSVGTGGIRNNRRPMENEEPKEYANRCDVQWHRVSIYPERLGDIAMKHVIPGSILYLEGNLETKIFTDPVTGLVRRIREIAIRRNGRIVFLGNGGDDQQPSSSQFKRVGYY